VTIYEALVMKAGVPDRAGNVYSKKALKEAAEKLVPRFGTVVGQGVGGRPHKLVGTRLVETPDSAELYMQLEN